MYCKAVGRLEKRYISPFTIQKWKMTYSQHTHVICSMVLPTVSSVVLINKLAFSLVNADVVLFHNQTVCKLPWRATTAFSCSVATLQFSSASVNFQRPGESGLSTVQKQPHPAGATHCFHCTTFSGPKWKRGLYAATVSLVIPEWFWRMWFYGFYEIMSPYVHPWPGNDCYTSPVGVLMSVEPEYFHIWSWKWPNLSLLCW